MKQIINIIFNSVKFMLSVSLGFAVIAGTIVASGVAIGVGVSLIQFGYNLAQWVF